MTRFLVVCAVLVVLLATALAAGVAFGRRRFAARADSEVARFAERAPATGGDVVTAGDLAALPAPVARWLERSGAVGRPRSQTVRLSQRGELQPRPGADWMPFRAEQWVLVDDPAFLWIAHVAGPFGLHLAGRDRYLDGRGSMRIELLSLVPVVDAAGPTIDQGALVRFLAEMMWYPSAALSPAVTWESIDPTSARATIRHGGLEVSGVFRFEDGDPMGFEARRYRDGELETWIVDNAPDAFGEHDGVRVPTRSTITWRDDGGETWTWLRLEVVSLERDGPLSAPSQSSPVV